jgi:lipopolysaccharide/colanic/teichoic acid biosynthesis glycosyltransferase
LALAAGLLLLTLPLGGLVCLALKLDGSGPVLSQQPRLNHAGRRYWVLRFRSPETPLGEFLRYTRIENLPLLINVLRGEMTLMGVDGKPYAQDD